jgi:hypothetical protein
VPWAVLLVSQMSLVFENTQLCAHGRGARRIGELFMNLRRRCVPAAVDDVHDLTLTPAEVHRGRGQGERDDGGLGHGKRSVAVDTNLSPLENILSLTGFVNSQILPTP